MNETEPGGTAQASWEAADSESVKSAQRSALVKSLFEEHNRALMGFLVSRLRSPAEAQDVAQEAYVRLLQLDQTDAVGFLRFRLFRIAANLVVDRLRRKARHHAAAVKLAEEAPEGETVERAMLAQQQVRLIETALAELPPRTCRAFVMHTIDGVPTPEIARTLKISERMVRVLVSQAYDKCKTQLDLEERGL